MHGLLMSVGCMDVHVGLMANPFFIQIAGNMVHGNGCCFCRDADAAAIFAWHYAS